MLGFEMSEQTEGLEYRGGFKGQVIAKSNLNFEVGKAIGNINQFMTNPSVGIVRWPPSKKQIIFESCEADFVSSAEIGIGVWTTVTVIKERSGCFQLRYNMTTHKINLEK